MFKPGDKVRSLGGFVGYVVSYQKEHSVFAEGYFCKFDIYPEPLFLTEHCLSLVQEFDLKEDTDGQLSFKM